MLPREMDTSYRVAELIVGTSVRDMGEREAQVVQRQECADISSRVNVGDQIVDLGECVSRDEGMCAEGE